jgi:hypothetical protein
MGKSVADDRRPLYHSGFRGGYELPVTAPGGLAGCSGRAPAGMQLK